MAAISSAPLVKPRIACRPYLSRSFWHFSDSVIGPGGTFGPPYSSESIFSGRSPYWPQCYDTAAIHVRTHFLLTLPIFNPEPLGPRRYAMALLSLAIFILCFMPAPFLE